MSEVPLYNPGTKSQRSCQASCGGGHSLKGPKPENLEGSKPYSLEGSNPENPKGSNPEKNGGSRPERGSQQRAAVQDFPRTALQARTAGTPERTPRLQPANFAAEFRGWSFGCRFSGVSCFRYRVSGTHFQVSNFGFGEYGFVFRAKSPRLRMKG